MRYITFAVTIISLLFFLQACDSDSSSSVVDPGEPNIVDIASDDENFSILVDALLEADLAGTLSGTGPFTVFAPTDDAFNALPAGLLDQLTEEQLTEILTYHVLEGEVGSAALDPEQVVLTLSNGELFIVAEGGDVVLNGSSNVSTADIIASNGIIHVIDEVLLPDAFGDVVDNAVKRYFLSELVEAVIATGLTDALVDENAELTVFAPTNEAFAEIADLVDELTMEELTDVLLYHVIDSRVLSSDLQGEQTVETLSGDTITITVQDGNVMINDNAMVTSADNDGTNGVIHVIDSVLLPPAAEETSGTVTLGHIGANAWVIEEITGEGIEAEIGAENGTISLQQGLRYDFVNLGTGNHPFEIRNDEGGVLIAELGDGTLQDYEPANVVVDEATGTITFTYTGNLAQWAATYNCRPHPSMEGSLVTGQPVL